MTAITSVTNTASQTTKAGGPSQTDSKGGGSPVQQVTQKAVDTKGGGATEQATEGAKALQDAKIAEILEQLIKVLTELIAALKAEVSGGGDTTQKSTEQKDADKKTDGGGGDDPDLPPNLDDHDSTPHTH